MVPFVDLFCGFLRIPFQIILCFLLFVIMNFNVPVAITLLWISNPVPMRAIFYLTHRLGILILGEPNTISSIGLLFSCWSSQLRAVLQPLILGALVFSFSLSSLAFVLVRFYWRWEIAGYRARRYSIDTRQLRAP